MGAGPAQAKIKLVFDGNDVIQQVPLPLVGQAIGVITETFETILLGKFPLGSV